MDERGEISKDGPEEYCRVLGGRLQTRSSAGRRELHLFPLYPCSSSTSTITILIILV
jgi:hypothetical protein